MKSFRRTAIQAAATLLLAALGACESTNHAGAGDSNTVAIARGKAPAYADIANDYNKRVENLDRLFARANLHVTYFDEDGEQKTEEPEGRLQIIRPNRLALSLGKAGQTLFWFGCDPDRYWWFDLSNSNHRIVAYGRHERFEESASRRIGLAVQPLDLIRVLAISPLDPAAPGATQWSEDGTLLGITTPIGSRGFERLWVDPKSLMPRTVEIFDTDKELVLVAEHEGSESVDQTRGGVTSPRISGRVLVSHLESGTDIRLTLTGAKDGPISDKAFDMQTLLDKFAPHDAIDLDKPSKRRAGGEHADIQDLAGR